MEHQDENKNPQDLDSMIKNGLDEQVAQEFIKYNKKKERRKKQRLYKKDDKWR